MKKTIALLCMAAGLLSCAKEIAPQEESGAEVPVKFEINVAETKSALSIAKSDWETGDLIYVFIMGIPDKYVKLTRESDGSWSEETVGEAYTLVEFGALDDNYELTAVYFPVDVDIAYENVGDWAKNKFTFTRGGKPVFGTYYLSDQTTYTLSGTTVTASLQMKIPMDMVQLYFPGGEGITTLADHTLACPFIKPVACASVGLDGTLHEDEYQAGARVGGGLPYEQGVIFAGRYYNAEKESVHTFSLANEEKIWTFTVDRGTAGPLTEGNLYTFPNFPGSGWGVELASNLYVDLGLTSGLKWAKCNLGATNEAESGEYFAWGEVATKTVIDWNTYLWMQEGQSDWKHITKYTFEDGEKEGIWYEGDNFIGDGKKGLKECGNADDAAYAALGGKFRLPTGDEWAELVSSCTWTWKTTADGYARNGYLVTGPNNRTIFLPTAGFRFGTAGPQSVTAGYYWSSTLSKYSETARYVFFNSEKIIVEGNMRELGFSLRPVSD